MSHKLVVPICLNLRDLLEAKIKKLDDARPSKDEIVSVECDKATVRREGTRASCPTAAPTPTEDFILPSMNLLNESSGESKRDIDDQELTNTAAELQEVLEDFGIAAEIRDWTAGPTATLFRIELPSSIRISQIKA